MVDHTKLSKNLRENILSILLGTPTRAQMNGVIAVSHALAHAFIASKRTARTLIHVYDLSLHDLAYDCIAELFQQDGAGNYLQLQSYFSGLPLTMARDEEVLAYLRQLVFSKVNHGIYRIYSESDPSLAKVLRNIKIAIHSLNNFSEAERFGEHCISPTQCATLEHLPPFDVEELEQTFVPSTSGHEHIPEMLAKLSLFLREQEEHSRFVPLVTVALLIRSAYSQKQNTEADLVVNDVNLIEGDTIAIIKQTCCDVRKQTELKYVGRGAVREEIFTSYFALIESVLSEKFIGKNGFDGSLFESLQQLLPELTKEEYMNLHRNRVEYLLKLVEKEAVKRLKNM